MTLHLDWASHEAAAYACRRWHYSRSVPVGKAVKCGVWEAGAFKGVILYTRGATPHLGSPFGLDQTEVCELTRVALRAHDAPVSRMLAVSLRMLRRACPGLRLVVSYADADRGHRGVIYQAAGWIYVGHVNAGTRTAFIVHGRKVHPRTIGSAGGTQSLEWVRANLDPNAEEFISRGKFKYLMPLDDAMREQLAPLARPYPKREGARDAAA